MYNQLYYTALLQDVNGIYSIFTHMAKKNPSINNCVPY